MHFIKLFSFQDCHQLGIKLNLLQRIFHFSYNIIIKDSINIKIETKCFYK